MNKEEQVFLNKLLKNGFSIFNVENLSLLQILKSQFSMKLSSYKLEIFHKSLIYGKINNVIIRCYKSIKKVKNVMLNYFSLASNRLHNNF